MLLLTMKRRRLVPIEPRLVGEVARETVDHS